MSQEERRSTHPEVMAVLARLEERSEHTQLTMGEIKASIGRHGTRIDIVEKRNYKMIGGLTVAALVWGWVSKHISF
jgi:hypothetical protein